MRSHKRPKWMPSVAVWCRLLPRCCGINQRENVINVPIRLSGEHLLSHGPFDQHAPPTVGTTIQSRRTAKDCAAVPDGAAGKWDQSRKLHRDSAIHAHTQTKQQARAQPREPADPVSLTLPINVNFPAHSQDRRIRLGNRRSSRINASAILMLRWGVSWFRPRSLFWAWIRRGAYKAEENGLVREERVELSTFGSGGRRSIQLSYSRTSGARKKPRVPNVQHLTAPPANRQAIFRTSRSAVLLWKTTHQLAAPVRCPGTVPPNNRAGHRAPLTRVDKP